MQVAQRWIVAALRHHKFFSLEELNQAIREALPEVRKALASHPEVTLMMRAIKFSDTASWHVGVVVRPMSITVQPTDCSAATATR